MIVDGVVLWAAKLGIRIEDSEVLSSQPEYSVCKLKMPELQMTWWSQFSRATGRSDFPVLQGGSVENVKFSLTG